MIMASAVISTGRKRVNPELQRRGQRVLAFSQLLLRKAHHQDAIGGRNSHAHDGTSQRRNTERGAGDEQKPHDAGKRRGQAPR